MSEGISRWNYESRCEDIFRVYRKVMEDEGIPTYEIEGAIACINKYVEPGRRGWPGRFKFTKLFTWSSSPQGHRFWSDLHCAFDNAVKELPEPDDGITI